MNDKELTPHSTGKEAGFAHSWGKARGIIAWLNVVNNQPLGRRFMATSIFFFLIGGLLALLIRLQLLGPENNLMSPEFYNQMFTMHGSIMMFLFVVPFLEGLTLYILPLMIGSRDMAFPRLSAFSYWLYLFGGLLLLSSLFTGSAPDAGWFAYTPLSGPKYSGVGIDFWVLGLGLVEISGVSAGIEIVVTIMKFRASRMRLDQMPLFVWSMLITGIMIIFAFTVLLMATFMLELDRMVGTAFFDPDRGGSSLLWQHLFWFFGHPEVYIMFLPAAGIVSTVISAFAKRQIVAYPFVVMALVIMGFLSFGLWVHHMFTTGLPELASAFFTGSSLMIAVASGIQIFAWIATLWGRKLDFKTPLLYVLGFFFIFTLGGLTGVMVAVVPFDWQVHDTYFIVAHFHYVLIGGVVFPIFSAITFWFPKITGKMLSEGLGKISFWLIFIGFNATFFPMHIMGLLGMPRRVYTYPKELGIEGMNILASIGAFVMAAGVLIFIFNALKSIRSSKTVSPNPWGASSLEWELSSPPPIYAFLSPPVYSVRDNLYVDEKLPPTKLQKALTAAPVGWRATQITSFMDGEDQGVQWLPSSTMLPFVSAVVLSFVFIGALLKLYLLSAIAFLFFTGLLTQWLWPTKEASLKEDITRLESYLGLTCNPTGSKSILWWGMICFLITLTMGLGSLIFSYVYIWLYSQSWPQEGLPLPALTYQLMKLAPLLPNFLIIYMIKKRMEKEKTRFLFVLLFCSFLFGLLALVSQLNATLQLSFSPTINAYGSLVHVIHWFEFILMGGGMALSLGLLIRVFTTKIITLHPLLLQVQLANMYWAFLLFACGLITITLCVLPRIL